MEVNKLFDKTCDKINHLISDESCITDSTNHNFGRITIDSFNSLPFAKILAFYNLIILIKSVVNKNKIEYYYNIYFRKRFV